MEAFFIGNKQDFYSSKIQYCTIQDVFDYLNTQKFIGIDIETSYKFPINTFPNEKVYQPGLDPYLSKVCMLQLGTLDKVFVIDTRTEDITALLPLWGCKDRMWIGHNLKFEAKHLKHNYNIVFHKIWDTMLVEQNLTNGLNLGYSLEKLANRYLFKKSIGTRDLFSTIEDTEDESDYIDKSIRMGFLHIGDTPFTEAQITYGVNDIVYPITIRQYQKQGINGYAPSKLHKLECDFCLVLADIELKGITFDKDKWIDTYNINKAVFDRRLEKLNTYVEKNHLDFCAIPDLFNPTASGRCLIEWSSSKQVIELFKKLKFCPKEKSKQTGNIEYTVGAKSLLKLLNNEYKEKYNFDVETDIVTIEDLILNYLLFKVSEQSCTTFGIEWLKYIHPITGRIHSTFRQILNTGRISSNNPNAQNLPSDELYRRCFIAPNGYKLLNADYSSQESRILAEVSEDQSMIDFFNIGDPIHKDDIHSWVGTKMFRVIRNDPNLLVTKKTHPQERNAAKSIGFKISYGGSAFTLKDDFGVEEEVAQEFIDGYMGAFPTLKVNFEEAKKKAIERGFIIIDTIVDRRWFAPYFEHMKELLDKIWSYYPDNYKELSVDKKAVIKADIKAKFPIVKEMWSEYFTLKGSLERCALNYRIQGLAGSQTKQAGVLFRKYQIENNLQDKVYLTSMIHDECLAEASDDFAEQGLEILRKCMIDGANMFCKKVKMDASGGICSWWNH